MVPSCYSSGAAVMKTKLAALALLVSTATWAHADPLKAGVSGLDGGTAALPGQEKRKCYIFDRG